MKLKICLLIIITIVFSFKARSNSPEIKEKKNTVFAEAGGGSASFYALSYDRLFDISEVFDLSLTPGFSYLKTKNPADSTKYPSVFFPVPLNGLVGKTKNHFEASASISYAHRFQPGKDAYEIFLFPAVGYRYQKAEGGLFIRVLFGALFDVDLEKNGIEPFPWGSFGIGYSF